MQTQCVRMQVRKAAWIVYKNFQELIHQFRISLGLYFRGVLSEAATGGILWKRCSLQFHKINRKTPMPGSLFSLPRPATLLKKRLCHRCFPMNFSKFLRTPFHGTPPVATSVHYFREVLFQIYIDKYKLKSGLMKKRTIYREWLCFFWKLSQNSQDGGFF